MAKEILAIPEQHLAHVIRVIRDGLFYIDEHSRVPIPNEVEYALRKWCDGEEEYLQRLASSSAT